MTTAEYLIFAATLCVATTAAVHSWRRVRSTGSAGWLCLGLLPSAATTLVMSVGVLVALARALGVTS